MSPPPLPSFHYNSLVAAFPSLMMQTAFIARGKRGAGLIPRMILLICRFSHGALCECRLAVQDDALPR